MCREEEDWRADRTGVEGGNGNMGMGCFFALRFAIPSGLSAACCVYVYGVPPLLCRTGCTDLAVFSYRLSVVTSLSLVGRCVCIKSMYTCTV